MEEKRAEKLTKQEIGTAAGGFGSDFICPQCGSKTYIQYTIPGRPWHVKQCTACGYNMPDGENG